MRRTGRPTGCNNLRVIRTMTMALISAQTWRGVGTLWPIQKLRQRQEGEARGVTTVPVFQAVSHIENTRKMERFQRCRRAWGELRPLIELFFSNSQKYQCVQVWILEKLQTAQEESYKDTTNLQASSTSVKRAFSMCIQFFRVSFLLMFCWLCSRIHRLEILTHTVAHRGSRWLILSALAPNHNRSRSKSFVNQAPSASSLVMWNARSDIDSAKVLPIAFVSSPAGSLG